MGRVAKSQTQHRRRRWGLRAVAAVVVATPLLVPSVAPATVTEQRERLPPPAFCEDPVAGVWKSHRFDPRFQDWHIHTLTIRRTERPGEIVGNIHARVWEGGPDQAEPPSCNGINVHYTVIMDARGSISDKGEILFGGKNLRWETQVCGPRRGYNIDHFSGTIDPTIQEFQSVNNDGGRAVNDPVVFRRVSCDDQPAPTDHHNPIAPPFQPPQLGGCGCGL